MKPARTILFVCTGNTCRSPMAAALLRLRLGAASPWKVSSAGLAAAQGAPAAAPAICVMHEIGAALEGHRARLLTAAAIDAAQRILVMTAAHERELLQRFPQAAGKVCRLGAFSTGPAEDIPDPIGGSSATYRAVRQRLESAIADLILCLHLEDSGSADHGRHGKTDHA